MRLAEQQGVQLPKYVQKEPRASMRNVLWAGMLVFEMTIYGSYSTFVNLSEEDGQLPYNTASVVLLIEVLKLTISTVLFLPDFKNRNYSLPRISKRYVLSYAVPAVLYAFNNNIALTMQLHMDPTSYQVLSNMKIASTALLYKVIIKRAMTRSQWIAIGLLLLAGVCDSYGGYDADATSSSPHQIYITFTGIVLITTYCAISGLAAVYTEYILKRQFSTSLHLQNIFLYTYGLVFNFTTFLWQSRSTSSEVSSGFLTGFSIYTWLIVISQALNGLIMSVVMKHGSNLTRLFIISGAMLTSSVMAVLVFGAVISVFFVISAALVIAAIYLYHH